ncbi:hypothetical protein [Aeromicrobium piscarium]|uniref:Uncharacterized protein n=1 Tax=Aeromicrobium piscarium TaxID=2590901 RepID=A0A554SP29_9ACTN|nr:hypothetical protein [Aeromicrobium piscarium]TSD68115.1 hypothetical protein FNM00_00525 [Aeromicrobium piscarium]
MTPLEELHEAIVKFARETSDCEEGCSVIVPTAVVTWEELHFADGDQANRFRYSQTGDSISMSSAIGLLDLGKSKVTDDILGGDDDE